MTESAAKVISMAEAERVKKERAQSESRAKAEYDMKEKAEKTRKARGEKAKPEAYFADRVRAWAETKERVMLDIANISDEARE